jgi:hypothetical protein
MKKIGCVVVGIILAAAVAALVVQNQAQAKLRADNESLRQQLDQLARLQADNETLSNQLARAQAAADAQITELMKLRNEVGMLRKQAVEMAGLQKKNQQLSDALASSRAAQLAKPPPQTSPKANDPNSAATEAATRPDLGSVQLVNKMPRQIDLGGGRACVITATINADGNYDIEVTFESKMSDGSTVHTQAEITTPPGHAVSLNAGVNSSIEFTPTVSPGP